MTELCNIQHIPLLFDQYNLISKMSPCASRLEAGNARVNQLDNFDINFTFSGEALKKVERLYVGSWLKPVQIFLGSHLLMSHFACHLVKWDEFYANWKSILFSTNWLKSWKRCRMLQSAKLRHCGPKRWHHFSLARTSSGLVELWNLWQVDT